MRQKAESRKQKAENAKCSDHSLPTARGFSPSAKRAVGERASRRWFSYLSLSHAGNVSTPPRRSATAPSTAGFSLIELLAVTAILSLVTTVMLANNARFGGKITLQNLVYGMAVSVRQAQVYGISVARHSGDDFSAGYGMHFDSSNQTTYVLFADSVIQNGLYDGGDELVAATTLQSGNAITDLCATDFNDIETCSLDSIDILFKRPEPDAYISINGNPLEFAADGSVLSDDLSRRAKIVVTSPRGDVSSVVVEVAGQISVQ